MQIELSEHDAEVLRELLQHRVRELDKEINRTDRRAFKEELQRVDQSIERVLGTLAVALGRTVGA